MSGWINPDPLSPEARRVRDKVVPTIAMIVAPFGPKTFSQAIMHTVALGPLEIANAETRAATLEREIAERIEEAQQIIMANPQGGMIAGVADLRN